MNYEVTTERLLHVLIAGDRTGARAIVNEMRDADVPAETMTHEVFWPTLEMVGQLFRADQLSTLGHHYAIRLLRTLIDQAQAEYTTATSRNKRILLFCGPSETDEMCGQLMSDLVEADGYEVFFGGGGVANDEILAEVGERRPDILMMFGSGPSDAPNIRLIIDSVREVAACPNLQIVVGGGVFNRAEGLAEEIGADLWSSNPRELIEKLTVESERRATSDQRTVGRMRRTAAA